jgi:hypothetical protein
MINSEYIQNVYRNSQPLINFNNFMGTGNVFYLTTHNYYLGTASANYTGINAQENYWNVTNPLLIDNYIWDKNDQPALGLVDYNNRLESKNVNAGIR